MEDLLALICSLDRCPHGRHAGDACLGWRGPGAFDGGCLGGRSLGNPYLHVPPPGQMGTDVHGFPITLNDIMRVGGMWHWVQYVVKMGDGTLRIQKDPGRGDGIPATREEAEEFARNCGDPLARVMVQRVCPWVNAQYDLPVPVDPQGVEESDPPRA